MNKILPVSAIVVATLDILIVFALRSVPDVQLAAIYALVAVAVYLALDDGAEEDV